MTDMLSVRLDFISARGCWEVAAVVTYCRGLNDYHYYGPKSLF